MRLEKLYVRFLKGRYQIGYRSVKRTDFSASYKHGGAPSVPVNMRCKPGIYRVSYRLNVSVKGRRVITNLLRRSTPANISC